MKLTTPNDIQKSIDTLESGLLTTNMTKNNLVLLFRDEAQKILDILRSCPSDMKIFTTDGELYDESLTRPTENQAETLKRRIIRRIDKFGYLNILWLVTNFSHLPTPRNLGYAASHGWIADDIPKFEIKKLDDGRYAVYVGTPRKLTVDILNSVQKKEKPNDSDQDD